MEWLHTIVEVYFCIFFEEHCCHHTFSGIVASIHPQTHFAFIHPKISVRSAFHFDHLYLFLKSIAPSYIFEHWCLHTTQPEKHSDLPPNTPGSFRLITLIKFLNGHKSLLTLCDGPEIEWKSESVTGVDARDILRV